jgi:hypothetical protein
MELQYSRMFTQIRAFKNLRKMLTPFCSAPGRNHAAHGKNFLVVMPSFESNYL